MLSQSANGWERQLNMVSWNDREPKYDIRDWSPDGSKMGKGISLSRDEIAILKGIAPARTGCWSGFPPPTFSKRPPPPVSTAPARRGW